MEQVTKDIETKVADKKPLTKEEETAILKSEGPVEGFGRTDKTVSEEPKADVPAGEGKAEKKEAPAAKAEDKEKKGTEASGEKRDFFVRLEQEILKPEGQEDLNDFSPREKAYFAQMRRDRKARQKAEEERDVLLFKQSKEKKEEPVKKEEPAPVDPIEELKKKDATDFLTVGEVIKILEGQQKEKKEEPKPEAGKRVVDPVQTKYLKFCDDEARAAHGEDYDAVMELTEEIVSNNREYLVEIAEAMSQGENPAIKTYQIIKKDPEFQKLLPMAQARAEARKTAKKPETKKEEPAAKSAEQLDKEKKASEAEKALETNDSKRKTTGHIDTASDKGLGDLTVEDIKKMSDREFAKLPKKTREHYLKLYG